MTLNRAEKITGLTILRLGPELFRASGVIGQYDAITADPAKAAEAIVAWNWRAVSAVVRKRAGYRCEECGLMRGLEIHHIVKRSQGRSDAPSGLKALCSSCHGAKFGPHGRRS